jgi:hypothetical protein
MYLPGLHFDVNAVERSTRLHLGQSEFAVAAQQFFGYQRLNTN